LIRLLDVLLVKEQRLLVKEHQLPLSAFILTPLDCNSIWSLFSACWFDVRNDWFKVYVNTTPFNQTRVLTSMAVWSWLRFQVQTGTIVGRLELGPAVHYGATLLPLVTDKDYLIACTGKRAGW